MAYFTALVALLARTGGTAAGAAEVATRLGRWAVTRQVASGAAIIAGLLLRCLGAFAGEVATLSAVVAGRGAFRWTVASLMR